MISTNTVQDVAELISLGLTLPTISLAWLVVWLFYNPAASAFLLRFRSAAQWVALGITIGFAGAIGDNAYWMLPWTAKYLKLGISDSLVDYGVFFNIFFRQLAGILAGYCHARSVFEFVEVAGVIPPEEYHEDIRFLNRYITCAALMGVIYVLVLLLVVEVR